MSPRDLGSRDPGAPKSGSPAPIAQLAHDLHVRSFITISLNQVPENPRHPHQHDADRAHSKLPIVGHEEIVGAGACPVNGSQDATSVHLRVLGPHKGRIRICGAEGLVPRLLILGWLGSTQDEVLSPPGYERRDIGTAVDLEFVQNAVDMILYGR